MIIFTDGACKNNPGAGGYAAVIIPDNYEETQQLTIISGGELKTTNNRMELTAVIKALEYCFNLTYIGEIIIYSDSQYVTRAINEEWLERWIDKHFKGIKNQDLWLKIWKYICKLNVRFEWIRGHSDITYNELADKLASEACFFQGEPFIYNTNINNILIKENE